MKRRCKTWQDFERLVANSYQNPVFLFKHSTRCPISASRWQLYQTYADQAAGAELWYVMVVEDPALSTKIAHEIDVQHQSPQVILFQKGQAVWHTSHWSITAEAMNEALQT